MIRLILGGQSSGKSALGLQALEPPERSVLLVTGKAMDASFRERIIAHQLDREPAVRVVEVGCELAEALDSLRRREDIEAVLVDALDFWLFLCLESGRDASGRRGELLASLAAWRADSPRARLTLVSSEVSLGPVAADSATRAFVQELGRLNQQIASLADETLLVVAGLAVRLGGAA